MLMAELLKLEGEDFVKAAYETILSRAGEPEGVKSYIRGMAEGMPKANILLEMSRSPEGRRVRRIANGDLFKAIFECGPMAFTGFPADEGRLHRWVKIIFKKLLWALFRHELWNLYFSSVLAYEALERVDVHPVHVPWPDFGLGEDGKDVSSLPYGVWKTLKELEA